MDAQGNICECVSSSFLEVIVVGPVAHRFSGIP